MNRSAICSLVGPQLTGEGRRGEDLGHTNVQQAHHKAREEGERKYDVEVAEDSLGGPDSDGECGVLVLSHGPV